MLRELFLQVLQFPLSSKINDSKFQFALDYCQALYHEPLARVIVRALPVFDVKFAFTFTFKNTVQCVTLLSTLVSLPPRCATEQNITETLLMLKTAESRDQIAITSLTFSCSRANF